MPNKYFDTEFVDKALIFAINAHHNTERRGKSLPYIIHPMEVVAIVATMTTDPDLLAAAALHDSVEDCDVSIETIRKEFNNRVATIVENESDKFTPGVSEQDSWKSRKQVAIDRIKKLPRESKIVALGDKLSNARAMLLDYKAIGDKLWERFHCNDPKEHEWHYRGLVDSLSELKDTEAYKEFVSIVDELFKNLHK